MERYLDINNINISAIVNKNEQLQLKTDFIKKSLAQGMRILFQKIINLDYKGILQQNK